MIIGLKHEFSNSMLMFLLYIKVRDKHNIDVSFIFMFNFIQRHILSNNLISNIFEYNCSIGLRLGLRTRKREH